MCKEARGVNMRKTIHLCLSSHEEIMYRSEADLIMGFNCLALAILETESRLMGEGFMTTHHHYLVQTDDYEAVAHKNRYAYTRYFNAKYSRKGPLGESRCFALEVEGEYHTLSALNYVLRQGLHHGLSATPFGYPHCSANAFFRKEMGKDFTPPLLSPSGRKKYLPHNKQLPLNYRMDKNGMILREDIVDTSYVERLYVTPRSFCFYMNRVTDEKSIQKQKEENDLPPVTLSAIESGVKEFDVEKSLRQEYGRVDTGRMTDLELCRIIDDICVPRIARHDAGATIYTLSKTQREDIGNALLRAVQDVRCGAVYSRSSLADFFEDRKVSDAQIRRCLALE